MSPPIGQVREPSTAQGSAPTVSIPPWPYHHQRADTVVARRRTIDARPIRPQRSDSRVALV